MSNSRYVSTAEACDLLATYSTRLWTLVGTKLSPPYRASPRKVFWLRSEVEALAAEMEALKKHLNS